MAAASAPAVDVEAFPAWIDETSRDELRREARAAGRRNGSPDGVEAQRR